MRPKSGDTAQTGRTDEAQCMRVRSARPSAVKTARLCHVDVAGSHFRCVRVDGGARGRRGGAAAAWRGRRGGAGPGARWAGRHSGPALDSDTAASERAARARCAAARATVGCVRVASRAHEARLRRYAVLALTQRGSPGARDAAAGRGRGRLRLRCRRERHGALASDARQRRVSWPRAAVLPTLTRRLMGEARSARV